MAQRTCRKRQEVLRSLEWLAERGLARRDGEGRSSRSALTEAAAPALQVLRQYDEFFAEFLKLELRDEWLRLMHLMTRARDILRTGIPTQGMSPGLVPPPVVDSYLWDP